MTATYGEPLVGFEPTTARHTNGTVGAGGGDSPLGNGAKSGNREARSGETATGNRNGIATRNRRWTVAEYKQPRAGVPCTVRCDACGNLFEDVLGEMRPCPHCHQFARGAA